MSSEEGKEDRMSVREGGVSEKRGRVRGRREIKYRILRCDYLVHISACRLAPASL